jgi:hypothetical protein
LCACSASRLFLVTFAQPATLSFSSWPAAPKANCRWGARARTRDVAIGSHRVLLDKTGVLKGAALVGRHPDEDEQREELRRLLLWFGHDLFHFATAFARGRWWWAYGELETLRRSCVGLIRLRRDFADMQAASECYFKVYKRYPPPNWSRCATRSARRSRSSCFARPAPSCACTSISRRRLPGPRHQVAGRPRSIAARATGVPGPAIAT